MISRRDGPPGETGAPVTGRTGQLAELDDPGVGAKLVGSFHLY
jgi:hypothetical protein